MCPCTVATVSFQWGAGLETPVAETMIEMSELLFECYRVPSVMFGIDALFSFYANGGMRETDDDAGIVISAGNTATHIIPTLRGKGLLERTKR